MTEPEHNEAPRKPETFLQHVFHVAGDIVGLVYVLVTLLFGPIKSLARWLARQEVIQRYKNFIAHLPPAAGLTFSVLSLGALELSKVLVILAYRAGGVPLALLAILFSKASLGYFAHTTWTAARPKVVAAYPRVRAVDAWVEAQLLMIRGFKDRLLARVKASAWYPAAHQAIHAVRQVGQAAVKQLRDWLSQRDKGQSG